MQISKMGFLRVVVFVFIAPCLLWGQMTTATISGVAKDQIGAVVPGVAVRVKNMDTGGERMITTNARGIYLAPNLSPGNYELEASLAGFQTIKRSGIVLAVGSEVVVDLELEVGATSQTVEVTGELPVVETNSSALSGLMDQRSIRELPSMPAASTAWPSWR